MGDRRVARFGREWKRRKQGEEQTASAGKNPAMKRI